jgi:uncharacterized protein (DUF2141 family)
MKRVSLLFATLLAALFLVLHGAVSAATTCVEMPPLKPLHRICGVVFFPSGDRIANAKVLVLQAGKVIALQQTSDDGKFSFDQLKAGNYELRVRVEGGGVAATQVVLVNSKAKCKQEVAVNMSLNGVCSGFSLVDSKKFEAGLNQSSS